MTADGQGSRAQQAPGWLRELADVAARASASDLLRFELPAGSQARQAAVLMLLGESDSGPDILLIERASDMRAHAGQPAFPGGAMDEGDADLAECALREAAEETNLCPEGVEVVATLTPLWIPPSGFVVTPVLGWWREPSPVFAGDPLEVAAVHRVPIAELSDPVNRVRVQHPSGYVGPGFAVRGMLVWGFTGMLLSGLIALAGWEIPWQPGRLVPLDDGWRPPADGSFGP